MRAIVDVVVVHIGTVVVVVVVVSGSFHQRRWIRFTINVQEIFRRSSFDAGDGDDDFRQSLQSNGRHFRFSFQNRKENDAGGGSGVPAGAAAICSSAAADGNPHRKDLIGLEDANLGE